MIMKQFNTRSIEMGFGIVDEYEFDEINKAYMSLSRISLEKMIKVYWTDKDCFEDLIMLAELHSMSNRLETKVIRYLYSN